MAKAGFTSMIVGEDWNSDPRAVLKKVAALGFAGVELGLPENLCDALDLKDALTAFGLQAVTGHLTFGDLQDRFEHCISMARFMGLEYLTISWSPFDTLEYIGLAVGWSNRYGSMLKSEGFQLLYHNHAHELNLFDDRIGLDLLFERTDPEYLKAHPDTYWLKKGGQEPVEWLRRMRGRCPLVHLKDMAADGSICELGGGTLELERICREAENGGTRWVTYEQDAPYRLTPWQSVEASAKTMKKLGLL
jgi:sugar phosphate isomerase/epimerase